MSKRYVRNNRRKHSFLYWNVLDTLLTLNNTHFYTSRIYLHERYNSNNFILNPFLLYIHLHHWGNKNCRILRKLNLSLPNKKLHVNYNSLFIFYRISLRQITHNPYHRLHTDLNLLDNFHNINLHFIFRYKLCFVFQKNILQNIFYRKFESTGHVHKPRIFQ